MKNEEKNLQKESREKRKYRGQQSMTISHDRTVHYFYFGLRELELSKPVPFRTVECSFGKRKLEMLQKKYSAELNIELGSEGWPVLRFGFLLPWSLFLLAQIHTVGLCAEAVTHTSCLASRGVL